MPNPTHTTTTTEEKVPENMAVDIPFQIDEIYDQSNLTKSQLLIWVGQKLNPQIPLYNMVLAFTIKGGIQPTYFQRAFQALINTSDALRMVFEERNGIPHQRLLREFSYTLEFIDFSDKPEARTSIQDWLNRRSKLIFDPKKPLFDSALVKLGAGEFIWFLNQHHLITDAWSTSLVYRHLAEFYKLATEKRLNNLPGLPSYNDFISFERNKRMSSSHKKAVSYWHDKTLGQFTPTDFYGKAISKKLLATERVSYDLGRERAQRLKEIALEKEVRALTTDLSVFNIFVTVLFAFLHRVGGNKNIALGTPSHNRPSAVFKETIGLFIEIFPLHITIQEGETYLTLLKKVKVESNKFFLYAHPGSSIPQSNNSFNVLLNFIHASFPDFMGFPMDSQWIHPGYGDRGHSLRLQVHDFDEAGTFLLHFDFNVNVFNKVKREWAIHHFVRIMDGFINDKSSRIDDVDLISADQKKLVVVDFNHTAAELPVNKTVTDFFENQTKITPRSIALMHKGKRLTYEDLNSRSNQLAHYLKTQGVGPGEIVGVYLRRSPQMIMAIWGILKTGAAYVPIDFKYPEDRIEFILKDTRSKIVLNSNQSMDRLSEESKIKHINLDNVEAAIANESVENLPSLTHPEDLAYIIYTSGSTGKPKGVMIHHHALLNYTLWARKEYLKDEVFDFPLFSSIAFDLTVTSLFLPLISGGKIVIYDDDNSGGDLSIINVIEDNAVDIIKLTPSHLSLINNLDVGRSKLKKFILGGEDLKCDLCRSITEKFNGKIKIYNEYGPTEATVGCMTYLFNPAQDKSGSVPIGGPIDNTRIYLLDDRLKPVPYGIIGEIHISGAGVAMGYYGRADLTDEKFIPNPFCHGQKMYKTGDLARWNEQGQMEFLGRRDQQVKIKGARIELGEVEEALSSQENVTACIVDVYSQKVFDESPEHESFCSKCGIPSHHPQVRELSNGVCNLCLEFKHYRDKAMQYFRPMSELATMVEQIKKERKGDYDCIMLLSGGKDSTYVLYQLVEMGLKILVFSMDNGYISEGAKANIRRVVKELNLDLVFGKTPAMNSIFVDSLKRFSNVCNGCFKTIYTLSMNMAREKGIKVIVTGLSRGQIFETRLADLFRYKIFDNDKVDQLIIEARKAYHRMNDAISQSLDVELFKNDKTFEEIQFIDFYRYCDAQLDDILEFLDKRAPWIRPADTGRSTNCLINELGIYIHKKERGYHNYALPYSWDVRLGHKQRDAAMEELDDRISMDNVKKILNEIGYDENEKFKDRVENRLAAYYVSQCPLTVSQLRSHLSKKLPDYMIPSYFVPLKALPLTPNGKVDRKALPRPERRRSDLDGECTPPGTQAEKILAKIWADVLKIQEVGIHDNFFDLGGDSIINIQIIHRAQRDGINLTPKQLFEYPTIAELARLAQVNPKLKAEQGLISGEVNLTPIQHWFFQQNQPNPQHWNHALLLEVKRDLDVNLLQDALQSLMLHHDMLRANFKKGPTGWQQFIEESPINTPKIEHFNFANLSKEKQKHETKRITSELHTTLEIFGGDFIRIAYFDLGPMRNNRILFIIHHLVIDGLSWFILLEDIQMAYEQLKKGGPITLPEKSTSFKEWASLLKDYEESSELQKERNFWLEQFQVEPNPLPVDISPVGPNTEISSHTVSANLDQKNTHSLLHDVPGIYNTQINDVLLTALTQCFSEWTHSHEMFLTLEGHGREDIIDGVNLSRTVGWFTCLFPIKLELQEKADVGLALRGVKEQLRRVPNHGIGYGIQRYGSKDCEMVDKLKSKPSPQILFNYLGQIDLMLADSSMFCLDRELELSRSPENERNYVFEINTFIFKGQLHVAWTYSKNSYTKATINKLSHRFIAFLQSIIDHCKSAETRGYTPSDFPDADLDQQELDDIIAEFS